MGKAILMSIRPQYVAKILNGEKTIEVRKKFPKDYAGWVYIYCTKGKRNGDNWLRKFPFCLSRNIYQVQDDNFNALNGYVVAKFWCDKISELECEFWEEPLFDENSCYQAVKLIERDLDYPDEEQLWNYHEMASNEDGYTDEEVYKESKFLQKCCLSLSEIKKYVGVGGETRCFGIHISKLEVFGEPKELKQFRVLGNCKKCFVECSSTFRNFCSHNVEKAPQSWQYIED